MKKPFVSRFSVSMPHAVALQLDAMAKAKGSPNRSQAVVDMVRAHLVEHCTQVGTQEIAGTITLVYDHHERNIQALLTGLQRDCDHLIAATLHMHLGHHERMEVFAVRGRPGAAKRLADRLTVAKGVTHGNLTVTPTGAGREQVRDGPWIADRGWATEGSDGCTFRMASSM
jgi:CopG family nickel-responsive transcriptional regulator